MGGFDMPTMLNFAGAVLTAIVSGIVAVWIARSKTRVDLTTQVATGFNELTSRLQEERNQLSEIIQRQRDEITAGERMVDEVEATVRRQRRRIATLEDLMLKGGIGIPAETMP